MDLKTCWGFDNSKILLLVNGESEPNYYNGVKLT